MYDVSGLYPLHQSLAIRSYVKMLVRRVLSDRYRIAQAKFQYQGVEICMTFQAYTLYQMPFNKSFDRGSRLETSYIFLLRGTGIVLVLFYIYPIVP